MEKCTLTALPEPTRPTTLGTNMPKRVIFDHPECLVNCVTCDNPDIRVQACDKYGSDYAAFDCLKMTVIDQVSMPY